MASIVLKALFTWRVEPVDDEGTSGCLRGGRADGLDNAHRQAHGQKRRWLLDVGEQTERDRGEAGQQQTEQEESRHAEPRRQPSHHRERQQLGERVAAEDGASGGVAQTAKMRLIRIERRLDDAAAAGKEVAGR